MAQVDGSAVCLIGRLGWVLWGNGQEGIKSKLADHGEIWQLGL